MRRTAKHPDHLLFGESALARCLSVAPERQVLTFQLDRKTPGRSWPLALVEIDGPNRLMIVTCHYVMSDERKRGTLAFDIDPESVTFHLFEAVVDVLPPESEST